MPNFKIKDSEAWTRYGDNKSKKVYAIEGAIAPHRSVSNMYEVYFVYITISSEHLSATDLEQILTLGLKISNYIR